MAALIETYGGIHGFLEFEIKQRKVADVRCQTELISEEFVDKLIRKKMGIPELVYAHVVSEYLPSTSSAPAEVSLSSDVIQSSLQSIKEIVAASIDEKLNSVDQKVSATVCADLKATLSSDLPAVMGSAIQTESDNVVKALLTSLRTSLLRSKRRRPKLKKRRLRCFLMYLTDR